MSKIFGEQHCSINDGETEVVLEKAIISPSFDNAEIVHESCLTGFRCYSKMNNYFKALVIVHLFKYTNANQRAKELLLLEGKSVTFIFAQDGGLVQQMHIEKVDIYPLFKPYADDVAIIKVFNQNYIMTSRRLKDRESRLLKTDKNKFIRTRGIII